MARKPKAVRGKFSDEKYLGAEPDLRGTPSNSDIINAYSWYNYFYDAEQAKAWVIEYLKEFNKTEKELIKNVNRVNCNRLITSGWNCRILLLGGSLPQDILDRNDKRIRQLALASGDDSGEGLGQDRGRGPGRDDDHQEGHEAEGEVKAEVKEDKVISIQERVANRANELIADVEVHLDNFYREGTMFKPADWLSQQQVKPAIAQRIADHYKPLYAELYDALMGKDPQLREGYAHYKKPKLKAYVEFIKGIISAAELRSVIAKASRKPRKKKEKPASAIVAKLKYKEKDEDLKIVSIDPKQVLGSNQLWVYNTKYRTIAVYNAMGPAGLGIKGSTLTGFDEKTSIVKKLRKPPEQIKKLMEGGKIVLRKYMDDIKCKPKEATGRINSECLLVRNIK
jgi:hypothetical protein